MRQHLCASNPDTPGEWIDGTVSTCPYHGHKGNKQLGFKWGRNVRRKMDREAGTVGIDRGDYING